MFEASDLNFGVTEFQSSFHREVELFCAVPVSVSNLSELRQPLSQTYLCDIQAINRCFKHYLSSVDSLKTQTSCLIYKYARSAQLCVKILYVVRALN